jgi:GNAT superfamily N-acetyltransferase
MLFADITLAARIERAECRMLQAACDHVARRRGVDTFALPIAGGVAAFTGAGSPLNKVAGLGFGGPLEESDLARIERAYREQTVPVQVEVSTLADPAVVSMLTRRDYVLVGFENVLGRALTTVTPVPESGTAGVSVRVSEDREIEVWLDTVVAGFAFADARGVPSHESFDQDELRRVMGDSVLADGVVRYLAELDGVPAGGASMRLDDGVAQLTGAATLPASRRRGVQRALLERRLTDAGRAGCAIAVITTQPGSTSMQNAQRQGFELLYSRAVLVRALTD